MSLRQDLLRSKVPPPRHGHAPTGPDADDDLEEELADEARDTFGDSMLAPQVEAHSLAEKLQLTFSGVPSLQARRKTASSIKSQRRRLLPSVGVLILLRSPRSLSPVYILSLSRISYPVSSSGPLCT